MILKTIFSILIFIIHLFVYYIIFIYILIEELVKVIHFKLSANINTDPKIIYYKLIPKLFYSSHKQLCHFTNKRVMGQHLDLKGFTSILLECNSFAVKTIHHKNEPQKYIGKSKHTHTFLK